MHKPIRWAYAASGLAFAGMGFIGIFVPVWPTTIFLILALWCFKRSSPRLEEWLLSNRWFGQILRDWDETRSMSIPAKVISISVIWLTIGISIAVVEKLWVRVPLAVIAASLTLYLIRVKTKPKT